MDHFILLIKVNANNLNWFINLNQSLDLNLSNLFWTQIVNDE